MQANVVPNIGAANWANRRGLPVMVAHLFARPPMNVKLWQQGWPPSWRFAGFRVRVRA